MISGDIYIRLKHAKETLYVTIVEGRNLAATDKKGHCNPYVKLYLLPNVKTLKERQKLTKGPVILCTTKHLRYRSNVTV